MNAAQRDNPLLDMENVLVAPHIGGATKEASTRSSVARNRSP